MKTQKNKKLVVCLSILTVIILIAGLYFKSYNDKKELQNHIKLYDDKIQNIYNQFLNKKITREERLVILKNTIEDYDKYSNNKEAVEEVTKAYNDKIEAMKEYFVKEYDKAIKENTLTEVEKIEDKAKLNAGKDSLNKVLETIKAEVNIVCNEKEVKKYEKEINTLVKSYEDRVKAIEEAERKAAEEEAKRQEEANKNNQNIPGNNGSNNGGTNKPSNGGGSSLAGKRTPDGLGVYPEGYNGHTFEHVWSINLDTNTKIPGTDIWIDHRNGDTYDYYTGKFLYNGCGDWC